MSVKQKLFELAKWFLRQGINSFGDSKATQISSQLAEALSPTLLVKTDFGEIAFFCPGKLPEFRARTLLTKEPETLEWIGTFKETDILWDIGANVGVYSLYAAVKGHSVLAFEPSPGNYYLLSKNIEINKLNHKVFAYCIAFNDTSKLDTFYMLNTELGGSLNSFGQAIDWQGKPFIASMKQAMVGFSIDDFIKQFNPQFPNHIKIDVDGIEDRIITGAKNTLHDKRLKSILVEFDSHRKEFDKNVIEAFEFSGFRRSKNIYSQKSEDNKFHKSLNHIFFRI